MPNYYYLDVSGGLVIGDESGSPVDARLVLTKQEMLEIDDNYYMPEVYLTVCSDDGKLYIYNVNNPEDPETGKFKKFDGEAKAEEVEASDTAPANPEVGDKWLDTSTTPPTEKEWDGTKWVATTPATGEMIYDATNDKVLYFDGTEWKEIGGGVEKVSTLPATGEEGEIVYDESTGQYKVYEDGVWLTLAKTWEGTEAEYTTLGGDAWSTAHPDVIMFVK